MLCAAGEGVVSQWFQGWGAFIASVFALAVALAIERWRSIGRRRKLARIKELDRLRMLGS